MAKVILLQSIANQFGCLRAKEVFECASQNQAEAMVAAGIARYPGGEDDEPRAAQDKAQEKQPKKKRSTAAEARKKKALKMHAEGVDIADIASRLGVSEQTVLRYLP